MRREAIFLIIFILSFGLTSDTIVNNVNFHEKMQNATFYNYVKEKQPIGYAHYLDYDKDMKTLKVLFFSLWIAITALCFWVIGKKIYLEKKKKEFEKEIIS